MKLPAIAGEIRRRMLLNYRVDTDVARGIVPANFRVKEVGGFAIAGVCLIRLEGLRPRWMPSWLGMSSENSAHRIAVEWDTDDGVKEGVYVPWRNTDSRLASLAGGRIFPGVHHMSDFVVQDAGGVVNMSIVERGKDEPLVEFESVETDEFPADSVFKNLTETSEFFQLGNVGYSIKPDTDELEGLELRTLDWLVKPLDVTSIKSSYYDDESIFPKGSITFDHGLLMRDIRHEWHSLPSLRAE